MSNTKKRYEEAGLQPPLHEAPVSPDLHVVNTELQPVEVVPAPGRVTAPESRDKRTAPKTTTSPRGDADTKEA